jgi:DNA mismatch repair protein MutS2
MIFPEETIESKLGFDKLRQVLEGFAAGEPGRRVLRQIRFSSDPSQIRILHERLAEVLRLRALGTAPSLTYFDVLPCLDLIRVEGACLEAEPMRLMVVSLASLADLQNWMAAQSEAAPMLSVEIRQLILNKTLLRDVLSVITEDFTIADKASPELKRVRKRIHEEEGRARRIIEAAFRQAAADGYVPDGATTSLRDGRMTIPVMAEHKRRIRGYVVGESSTGQTVYLEPVEVMEAESELRNLRHEERAEVLRILRGLTLRLHHEFDSIRRSFDFMGEWDGLQAKARFLSRFGCSLPPLSNDETMIWHTAVNPVLVLSFAGARPVVPLQLSLSGDARMLVVSGPNAGGKSVCLKTTGLIQYMYQCGLPVPVRDDSRMMVFDDILLDIGDQQSVENDLSTYSSHLKNMKMFLEKAGNKSLVLLDELGAGTDPNFGGGIAEAVLSALLARGAWGVVTTHYHNLKMFAERTPGVVNASMMFDSRRLEPLFLLEVGKPGSSYALEIARRMGLPEDVQREAERIIGRELIGLEALLKKTEEEKVRLQKESQSLSAKQRHLEQELTRYRKMADELSANKKQVLARAREEAAELMRKANREIEKTIRHIRESKAEKKETKKVRKSLGDLTAKVESLQEKRLPRHPVGPIEVGSSVRIAGQEGAGTVIALDRKNARVDFAGLITRVPLVKLELAQGPVTSTVRSSRGSSTSSMSRAAESTLDLRGKRADEVQSVLQLFIDDAVLAGLREVRVLHGKGEGVLRKVVREELKRRREVARYADEHADRGGDGITVVTLE